MRVSEQWLREWVDPPKTSQELAEQLTMAGLEVDKVEAAAPGLAQVVVGRVVGLSPHPTVESLKVATVDVGRDALLQIVCGAPNVAVGLHAPTALVGAVLPNGVKIEAVVKRGVDSQGMLCSGKELALSDDASGLLALPPDSKPGTDLRQLLGLDDHVIEIDLTPNRGDCLGVVGIAREIGVLNRLALRPVAIEPVAPTLDDRFPVTLSEPSACPRFVGRVIKNIDAQARSPLWLVERLRRAGIRSLGPVVDITNYVMLELNQPMHAYDLNKLQSGIDVRMSRAGETLALLNGQTVELDDATLLITDASGPIGLAGIMGGTTSEVDTGTRDVFFECAFFAPAHIAGRARRYGLHTDASHRFERGVDPHGQRRAVERATRLLLDTAKGEAGPLIDSHSAEHLPQTPTIQLRRSRIDLLLGMSVDPGDAVDILQRLGMTVDETENGWRVTPPSHRADIVMEADLIEEIGRVIGYDRLPNSRPAARLRIPDSPERDIGLRALREALVQRGYQEVITYSFVEAALQQRLDPEHPPIPLSNPISTDMAVMRTSLWPGLVRTLAYNQKRQQERVRLFESGLNFRNGLRHRVQESYIGAIASGAAWPEQWGTPRRATDFYDLKGDVEALLLLCGDNDDFRFVAARHPALHPGQAARIERCQSGEGGAETLGWLGALHPQIARDMGLEGAIYLFELRVAALGTVSAPQFSPLSRFPASRRDLAVVVDEALAAAAVENAIRRAGGETLREVALFDVYRGPGVPKGRKSLAFGLIFQDFSSNLTDQAIDQNIAHILSELQRRFGAGLRD